MSQYPSAPPPGAYTPPNQSTPGPQQQSQYGYQQPQATTPYGSSAPGYASSTAASSSSNKPTNAFGQAFNQAVIQGKPMLNKLGKTISSKLGNKPPGPTGPQQGQSQQSYQQHHQQQQQQQQQQYKPQPYQAQNQQASPQPQQSPYQQQQQQPTNQAGNTYFPQQSSTTLSPSPSHPHSNAGYSPGQYGYGGNGGGQSQNQPPQGQQFNQGQQQHTPYQQFQPGSDSGQESGVIGASQAQPSYHAASPPPPPSTQQQQQQQQQQPWGSHAMHSPVTGQAPTSTSHQQLYNQASQPTQQQQSWSQPYPQDSQPTNQQQQQQWSPHHTQQTTGTIQQPSFNPSPPPLQYHAAPPVPTHPNQQQPHWNPTSPVSPQPQAQSPIPPSVSPALSQPSTVQQHQLPSPHLEAHHVSQPSSPAPPNVSSPATLPPTSPPTFMAELPADMGSFGMVEGTQGKATSDAAANPGYQAYRPTGSQSQSPGRRFSVPRRAVSTSNVPVAVPWTFADAATELPTREFFMIADLLYDAIDGKFEPKSTGLLEASKVLESWKSLGLAEEAAQLFAYDSYNAFARLWSLEGIPHMMVPCQASLSPLWNFQLPVHAETVKVPMGRVLEDTTTPTYMPAINRAGYYKYLFLEMMHEPEALEGMLTKLCADTYNPSVLNQPDIQKRDRSVLPGVAAQAATIRSACVSLVSQETAAKMQQDRGAQSTNQSQIHNPAHATQVGTGTDQQQQQQQGQADAGTGANGASMTDEEMVVKMHSLKMQQQFNHMMAMTMMGGGYGGGPNYGSLV